MDVVCPKPMHRMHTATDSEMTLEVQESHLPVTSSRRCGVHIRGVLHSPRGPLGGEERSLRASRSRIKKQWPPAPR